MTEEIYLIYEKDEGHIVLTFEQAKLRELELKGKKHIATINARAIIQDILDGKCGEQVKNRLLNLPQ